MESKQPTIDVEQRIREILESLGAELDGVTRETRLENVDVDSLDLIELAQIFEEDYKLQLTGDDFAGVETFGDTVDVVAKRMAQ